MLTPCFFSDNKENVRYKRCYNNSRIKQIIQKIEEINNNHSNSYVRKIDNNSLTNDSKLEIDSSQSSPVSEQIYELVTLPTYVNIVR